MPEEVINNLPINVDKAKAELCKRNFYFFVQEFWETVINEEPVWNWHIKYLCDELQLVANAVKERKPKLYDVIINVPPGSSKSTICSEMYIAWCWTIDPTQRFICGSYASTVALDIAEKCRTILLSEKYAKYFPEIAFEASAKSHIKNNKGGERYTASVGSAITGIHAHQIVIDDPVNPKQADSDVERATANKWMTATLSTRKVDKKITPTILIMQRLHEDDATGYLLKKRKGKGLKHICLPAELSKHVKPEECVQRYVNGLLDPIRMDEQVLDDAKADLGSYAYAGQYAQVPAPEGGEIWQKWFIPVPDDQMPPIARLINYGNDWDLAYTEKEKNSASAYAASGLFENKMYIYAVDYRFYEFPKLISWMKGMGGTHYIEAKASGKSAKQTLNASAIPAVEVKVQGGADKVARARAATPFAESGLVYVKQSILDMIYNDPKQGILKFPNASHDDVADAISQAIQRHFGRNLKKPGSA